MNGNYFVKSANTTTTNDYVYLLSASNMDPTNVNGSEYYNETSNVGYENAPLSWLDDINVTLYEYTPNNGTYGDWNISNNSRANYLNLRFPFRSIDTTIRIFKEVSSSIPSNTTIENAINSSGNIRSGDIFISAVG